MKNLGLAKKRRDEARNNLRKAIDSITSISGGRISQFEALHAIVDTVMKSIDENLPASYKTLKGGLAQTYLAATMEQAYHGESSTGEEDEDAILKSLLNDKQYAPAIPSWAKAVPKKKKATKQSVGGKSPYGVPTGTWVVLVSPTTGYTNGDCDAGKPFSKYYATSYPAPSGYSWVKDFLADQYWLKPVSMFPGEVVTVNPYGVKPGTKVTLYSKVTSQAVTGYDAGHPFSEIYIKNYKPAKGYAWHKEANGQVWLVPTSPDHNPFGVPQGTKVKVVVKGCSPDKANTYDAGLAFGFTAPCVYEPVEGYEWVPMGDICWLKPVA